MLASILSLLIFGTLCTGGVFLLLKSFAARTTQGNSNELLEEDKIIQSVGEGIEKALAYLGQMLPLSDALQKEQEIAAVRTELAAETAKLTELDAQLAKLQQAVEIAEGAHNELKKGKENSESTADELRANKDRLASETKTIEGELVQSQARLNALSEEVSLTDEQKAALSSVTTTLDNCSKQLGALADIYTTAATRFTNLETQYRELEKEYTKLVEKELSGKF